jgi:hypothetical protein
MLWWSAGDPRLYNNRFFSQRVEEARGWAEDSFDGAH